MRIARLLLACAIAMCIAGTGFAQSYPSKAVKVVIPFTPGSATDVIGRIVSEKLSGLWGQPVMVENVPGEGGTVGASVVAKSAPDGYTLLLTSSAYVMNPALYARLPYDPQKDFVDIAPIATQPFVLVTGRPAGVKSVSELVGLAKARPGQLKFGSAGTGSGTHFAAEKFKMATGIDVVHVPYKGAPEANADTIAGQLAYWVSPISAALKDVREGKLIALGVTGAKRSGALPDVPTMAEAGVVGFEATSWSGLWVPAGIPPNVADKLAQDVQRALASPDVREKFVKLGAEPRSMTQAEFGRFVRNEMESARRIAKTAGIKPQ